MKGGSEQNIFTNHRQPIRRLFTDNNSWCCPNWEYSETFGRQRTVVVSQTSRNGS